MLEKHQLKTLLVIFLTWSIQWEEPVIPSNTELTKVRIEKHCYIYFATTCMNMLASHETIPHWCHIFENNMSLGCVHTSNNNHKYINICDFWEVFIVIAKIHNMHWQNASHQGVKNENFEDEAVFEYMVYIMQQNAEVKIHVWPYNNILILMRRMNIMSHWCLSSVYICIIHILMT